MSLLVASAFLKALGWTLLNSIWQFAICWLLYRLIAGARGMVAAIKHTIALCLLFSGTVFFLAQLFLTYSASSAATSSAADSIAVNSTVLFNSWQLVSNYLDALMPYWSLLYLACILLLFAKLCLFMVRAGNLQHQGITKMDAAWRTYVKDIAAQLGIRREVKAFLSIQVDTPQVIGFLKPVILVPAACLASLSVAQLEAVLLHELVHIKRNDYLVNLLVASLEIFFFFNPFVKQLTASIRKEREYCCDDTVLQFKYHPVNYAAALLALEKNRLMPITYGIAASGKNNKQLLTRIERIVGINNKRPGFYKAAAGLLALLLVVSLAGMYTSGTGADKSRGNIIHPAGNDVSTMLYNAQINFAAQQTVVAASPCKISHDTAPKNVYTSFVKTAIPVRKEDVAATTCLAQAGAVAGDQAITVALTERRDYSLAEKAPADVPAAAEEPYVPANSFSFELTQDTTAHKIKGETYNERRAREALVKTQKALAAINWKKIKKDLKYNPAVLDKLKKEIALQLQSLDWQKIDIDAQNELSQEHLDKLQEAVKQDQLLKQYQVNEAYYEALQKQLVTQQQLIKESDQRMQETQKAVEAQQKKLQLEMSKRRIISI